MYVFISLLIFGVIFLYSVTELMKYHRIIVLPKGARNIFISESPSRNNFMGMSLTDPSPIIFFLPLREKKYLFCTHSIW